MVKLNIYKGIIVSNKMIGENYYHMIINCKELAEVIKEGQIVHFKIENTDTILRRPFSIYKYDGASGLLEFIYAVKGKGTEAMKDLKSNQELNLLGPTGNYYNINEKSKTIAIIGRGVGIASVLSVAIKARKEGKSVLAVLSGKNELKIFGAEELINIGCEVHVAYDYDKSSNVENMEQILEEFQSRKPLDELFVCGSNRLARLSYEFCERNNVQGYVSLEERMACGIGVCQGCVCETTKGYKTVCKDGPVFPLKEVIIDEQI